MYFINRSPVCIAASVSSNMRSWRVPSQPCVLVTMLCSFDVRVLNGMNVVFPCLHGCACHCNYWSLCCTLALLGAAHLCSTVFLYTARLYFTVLHTYVSVLHIFASLYFPVLHACASLCFSILHTCASLCCTLMFKCYTFLLHCVSLYCTLVLHGAAQLCFTCGFNPALSATTS